MKEARYCTLHSMYAHPPPQKKNCQLSISLIFAGRARLLCMQTNNVGLVLSPAEGKPDFVFQHEHEVFAAEVVHLHLVHLQLRRFLRQQDFVPRKSLKVSQGSKVTTELQLFSKEENSGLFPFINSIATCFSCVFFG